MPAKQLIQLTVNGRLHEVAVAPRVLLADMLREELALTGTHLACEQGVCGACTILLDGRAVRSCLMLAVQANGHTITTIEGVSTDGTLTPVQQAFNDNHGMQCGFCTSGFVVSLHGLLQANPHASEAEVMDVLGGHLCRCTGYQNIIKAARQAADAVGGRP
jgi:aerobic carbon-monoxide dehydrogenase small subunit